jgi:propionyl-CoA synthetase
MKYIYGIERDDNWFAASDLGWVVGHSYIVYAPLINGSTTILFEGKPILPDPGVYWRLIEEYNVKACFTAPTALRSIRKEDPNGDFIKKYDLSKFENLFVAGERCDSNLFF